MHHDLKAKILLLLSNGCRDSGTRHGIDEDQEAFKPQPFSLIVTIADPQKKVRVYDEMAQLVRNRFQSLNLTVRAAARVKART